MNKLCIGQIIRNRTGHIKINPKAEFGIDFKIDLLSALRSFLNSLTVWLSLYVFYVSLKMC